MLVWVQVDPPWVDRVDAEALVRAAQATLRIAIEEDQNPTSPPNQNWALTVHITNATTIQRLNRRYRGQDKPTDVLSFPSGESDPDTGTVYLGDVVIAYPVAEAQAQQGGHAVAEELRLLTVHGVLHLLGYDDQEPAARRRMWAVQERVLQALGCPLRPPL